MQVFPLIMESRILPLLFLLSVATLSSSSCPTSHYTHLIRVNKRCHKLDSSGYESCFSSLDEAFEEVLNNETSRETRHNVTICISQGKYQLSSSYNFSGVSDFAIVGNGSAEDVTIHCTEGAGLSFYNADTLFLKGFTLFQCGASQMSTSKNVSSPDYSHDGYLSFKVAMYIIFTFNVDINDVTWHQSKGTGLTFYFSGNVTIDSSKFIKNGYGMSNNESGGGGLQIEFPFCLPGNYYFDCAKSDISLVSNIYTSNLYYDIKDSEFSSNLAYKGFENILKSRNQKRRNYNFGKGGGLSVIFKARAHHNNISIHNCTFDGNKAHYGGGFYVGYFDDAYFNNFSMTNSNVSSNQNCFIQSSSWNTDESGGGGKIVYELNVTNVLGFNGVYITNSTITNNAGISGGGLYVCSSIGLPSVPSLVTIEGTQFIGNSAFLGSALYYGQRFSSVTISFKHVIATLKNCNFNDNAPICQGKKQTHSFLPCSGIIYSNSFDLHLLGDFEFENNNDTPIVLHSADLVVMSNSTLNFTNNTANEGGGGMGFYDCSYLTVYRNTSFNFISNKVLTNTGGGAIYSGRCNGDDQASLVTSECFVRQYNLYTHPENWNSTFKFWNNTVKGNPNSVFVTSMEPCWFPENNSMIVERDSIEYAFCWRNWKYNMTELENEPNLALCNANVKSGISFIGVKKSTVRLYSGQKLPKIELYDGKNRSVDVTDQQLSYCIVNGKASFYTLNSTKCTSNFGDGQQIFGRTNIQVKIETVDGLSISFNVHFSNCKWPLEQKQQENSGCTVPSKYFSCDNDPCYYDDIVFTANYQYCLHYIGNGTNSELQIAECPSSYVNTVYSQPYNEISKSNCIFSGFSARNGILCSECAEGYSVPINSFYLECLECSNRTKGWLLFLLIQILPMTLMVFAIIIFNVRLTKGYMYGFVLYCQLMSISFPGWMYPAWFSHINQYLDVEVLYGDGMLASNLTTITASTFLASVWNLNFMTLIPASVTQLCLFEQATSLAMISFWYVIAAYPLFLLLIIMFWLSLYNKGFKMVRFVTVPIHRVLARFWRMCGIEPSLVHTIASVYILTYTQFLCTSLKILNWSVRQSLKNKNDRRIVSYFEPSMEYFHSLHGAYGVLAICVLIFFILPPPLFLIFYSFNWFHRLMYVLRLKRYLWINHLADSFNGSFKNRDRNHILGYQYFSGLYLLIRIPFLCFYYLPESKHSLLLELEGITCLLCAGSIMILRPFKKNRYNFFNFVIFLYMALLVPVSIYNKYYWIILLLVNIPVALFILYILYILLNMTRHCIKYHKMGRKRVPVAVDSTTVDINDESEPESGDEFPDRLLYPENYSTSSSPVTDSPNATSNTRYITAEGSTRRGSILRHTASANYGSIQQ